MSSKYVPCSARAASEQFVDGILGVASPDTLVSRSRHLLQCLASNIAASGGGDYTVARQISVMRGEGILLIYKQGQLLPDHTTTP
eukprot:6193449-Pleurochrysis_carterae.AAC.3